MDGRALFRDRLGGVRPGLAIAPASTPGRHRQRWTGLDHRRSVWLGRRLLCEVPGCSHGDRRPGN